MVLDRNRGKPQKKIVKPLKFDHFKVVSFDCFGTLIDWETGILEAIKSVFIWHKIEIPDRQILELYASFESQLQKKRRFLGYREILRRVILRFGQSLGFRPSEDDVLVLEEQLAEWSPFEDSIETLKALRAGGRYQVIIASNIDTDLFNGSAEALQHCFDAVITAQQVGAYKPSERVFEAIVEQSGVEPKEILHVAQSLYHDINPASDLGMKTVWVNRHGTRESFGATPAAVADPDLVVTDLRTLSAMMKLA